MQLEHWSDWELIRFPCSGTICHKDYLTLERALVWFPAVPRARDAQVPMSDMFACSSWSVLRIPDFLIQDSKTNLRQPKVKTDCMFLTSFVDTCVGFDLRSTFRTPGRTKRSGAERNAGRKSPDYGGLVTYLSHKNHPVLLIPHQSSQINLI